MGQQHEWLVSGPGDADPNIHRATIYSSGAALALVVWDAILTLDNEIDHIWLKPGRKHVKCIYLFSKWFGLVNQIGIQTWYFFLATGFPNPVSTCEAFFIFESVTFQLLQLCLDIILILRIWAVYQRNYRYIGIAIVFFEILMSVLAQKFSVPKSVVDGTCIMLRTPETTSFIGIGMIITQSVLLSLTYGGKVLMQPAARRSKIITVVIRDGMFAFGVMIGITMISMLYLLFNQVVVNVLLPWLPVMPSLLTPRMILNMQAAVEPTESIEFTTNPGIVSSEIQLASVREMAMI